MRNYLFRGIREDNGELVEGHYYTQVYHEGTIEEDWYHFIKPIGSESWQEYKVIPTSVGQYTGMNEFVIVDKSFNKPLFEGDIVEVWNYRCSYSGSQQSKYDGDVKVRGVIRFEYGRWKIDLDNEYNKAICKLKGSEQDERYLKYTGVLSDYGFHHGDEDWHREHNTHYKWDDIVKIGTEFENSELLEG